MGAEECGDREMKVSGTVVWQSTTDLEGGVSACMGRHILRRVH